MPVDSYYIDYHSSDNPWLIGALFLFLLFTLFSCGQHGLLRRQLTLLFDTHNSRTFEEMNTGRTIARPLLLIQTFLAEGLCLLLLQGRGLYQMLDGDRLIVGMILLAPVIWFFFQWLVLRITAYLFGVREEIFILERVFYAVHLLLGPLMLLLCLWLLVGDLSQSIAIFLFVLLFILSQIIFIFSGIKIFFNGIGSLCFIILYLCTLEMAPLYVLYQKIAYLV